MLYNAVMVRLAGGDAVDPHKRQRQRDESSDSSDSRDDTVGHLDAAPGDVLGRKCECFNVD